MNFKDTNLQKLYAKYPSFQKAKAKRLMACTALTAVTFAGLLVVYTLATLLGVTFNPGILKFLACLPAVIVLLDQKVKALEWVGYFVLSYIAVSIVSFLYLIVIWALAT